MNRCAVFTALALVVGLSLPASAAVVGLQVEGGGSPKVYRLTNGNLLGLWGIDNREGANPGAGAVTISSSADLIAGFAGRDRIRAVYNGTNPLNPGRSEFDLLSFGFTIADNARLSDVLWIEWTGGTLTHRQPSGRSTTTMHGKATLPGDPFAARLAPAVAVASQIEPAPAVAVVPVPAALPLILTALAAFGMLARRRLRA